MPIMNHKDLFGQNDFWWFANAQSDELATEHEDEVNDRVDSKTPSMILDEQLPF